MWRFFWGTAIFDLRLDEATFWNLCPYEFWILYDRYEKRKEHEQLLAGLVASQVVNFSEHPPKEPIGAMDFFRRRKRKKAMGGGFAFLHALDRAAGLNKCDIVDVKQNG